MGKGGPQGQENDDAVAPEPDTIQQLADELRSALLVCQRMIDCNVAAVREAEALRDRCLSVLRKATPSPHRSERDEGVPIPLTEQESRVLEQICFGRTNRQIARRLGIGEKTAKNYVQAVFWKLGVHNRTEAAMKAARYRWYGTDLHDERFETGLPPA
ncbi:response regulator transcription factor [Nocardia goodfellowii]